MSRRGKSLGAWGEEQACNFLRRHGFVVQERNYYTTMGEIDVIAVKDDDYYFIEVKTRTDSELAHDDSITYTKRKRMAKAVRAYCYARSIKDKSIIMAGLIVRVKQTEKNLGFRFCIIT